MVTRMRIQKRTRRMKTMMENTNLVPATMKTKVVRVAMPSTKRIWFLNPPSSPRLESSLFRVSLFVLTRVASISLTYNVCHPVFLIPVKDVPVEELLSNLLVGEQVEQAVSGPHEDG